MKKTKEKKIKEEWAEKFELKANTLNNLMSLIENTPKINEKIEETLVFLCKNKTWLKIEPNGTKICSYCHSNDFRKEEKKLSNCKCISFHKSCLLSVCLEQSPELDPFQLNNICCLYCQKKFSLHFIENVLADDYRKEVIRIEEVRNRKIQCCICKREEKFDQMFERHCKHGFCKGCFSGYLEKLIKKNRGSIKDYVCPGENCGMPELEFSEFKTHVEDRSLFNYFDDYLEKIFDPRKSKNIIFKCKSSDCYATKVSNSDCKDQEYLCMSCESQQKNKDN